MPATRWWYNDDINLYHLVKQHILDNVLLDDDDLAFVDDYLYNLHHGRADDHIVKHDDDRGADDDE